MALRGETFTAPTVWPASWPTERVGRGSRAADVCTLAFFFIFYTNLAVVAVQIHGVPQVLASGFALLLFVPLARHLVVERQPLVVTPALPFLFAFLAALFLSAAVSTDPEVARRAIPLYLGEGLLLYLLVSNAVRTTEILHRIVWILILAGSLLGALSLYQELTQSYANNLGGFAQVDRLETGGGFNVAPEGDDKVLRPRLGGPLGSENRYAQILAVLLPLALMRVFREPTRRLRLLAAGGSLLITGGIVLSFSRGAAVALAATLAVMVLFRGIRWRQLAVLVGVLALVVLLAVPDYVVRLRSLEGATATPSSSEPAEDVDSAVLGRQTENLAAWRTFLDHPIVGVGPGVYFREYSREYANRLGLRYLGSERRAHSLYLEMAAETGMIGVGAFLAMVGATLVSLYHAARQWGRADPQRAMLASSFAFALFAYLATAVFLHLSYQRYFWVLLALANAVVWSLRREAEEELGDRSSRGAPAAA